MVDKRKSTRKRADETRGRPKLDKAFRHQIQVRLTDGVEARLQTLADAWLVLHPEVEVWGGSVTVSSLVRKAIDRLLAEEEPGLRQLAGGARQGQAR